MLIGRHRVVALILAVGLVAGCRSERPLAAAPQTDGSANAAAAQPPEAAALPDTDQAAAPPAAAAAQAAALPAPTGGVALAPSAPEQYVVKRGDTLWGIAKVFLRDPWHWPEIWQVNPQIHNPHRIYPGDTLRLVYVEGQPQLVLQRGTELQRGGEVRLEPRVRSEPLESAITTIPYETVAAFMSKPSVLSAEDIDRAAYLLASLNNHAAIAEGNTIYARGFKQAPEVGDELRHRARRRPAARSGHAQDPGV